MKLMIDQGARLACKSGSAADLCYLVAKKGNLLILEYLISIKAPFDQPKQSTGITPLGIAAYDGNLEMVRFLVEKGGDPTILSKQKMTPLYMATRKQRYNVVKYLASLSSVQEELRFNCSNNPLFYAIKTVDMELLRILLSQGVPCDMPGEDEETPLSQATRKNNEDIVEILCAYTDTFDHHSQKDYLTPFMYAILHGYLGIADILMQMGANVRAQDFDDHNVIQIAQLTQNQLALNYLKTRKLWNGVFDEDHALAAENYKGKKYESQDHLAFTFDTENQGGAAKVRKKKRENMPIPPLRVLNPVNMLKQTKLDLLDDVKDVAAKGRLYANAKAETKLNNEEVMEKKEVGKETNDLSRNNKLEKSEDVKENNVNITINIVNDSIEGKKSPGLETNEPKDNQISPIGKIIKASPNSKKSTNKSKSIDARRKSKGDENLTNITLPALNTSKAELNTKRINKFRDSSEPKESRSNIKSSFYSHSSGQKSIKKGSSTTRVVKNIEEFKYADEKFEEYHDSNESYSEDETYISEFSNIEAGCKSTPCTTKHSSGNMSSKSLFGYGYSPKKNNTNKFRKANFASSSSIPSDYFSKKCDQIINDVNKRILKIPTEDSEMNEIKEDLYEEESVEYERKFPRTIFGKGIGGVGMSKKIPKGSRSPGSHTYIPKNHLLKSSTTHHSINKFADTNDQVIKKNQLISRSVNGKPNFFHLMKKKKPEKLPVNAITGKLVVEEKPKVEKRDYDQMLRDLATQKQKDAETREMKKNFYASTKNKNVLVFSSTDNYDLDYYDVAKNDKNNKDMLQGIYKKMKNLYGLSRVGVNKTNYLSPTVSGLVRGGYVDQAHNRYKHFEYSSGI